MKAIAFSNHGGIYDWVKKKQDCDKEKIKYIHGIELYMCTELENDERGYHIGLYAKNLDGLKELNQLISIATSKGKKEDKSDRHFYYNPRISLKELMNTSDNIIITTACLASMLWGLTYKKFVTINNEEIEKEEQEKIILWCNNYLNKFLQWLGKNKYRCFLEIQYHDCPEQKEYNKLLWKWSKELNIPLIAGTDTHSSSKYKAECRKILQKSKDSFYGNEDEFDLTWKTYDELIECFKQQNALPEEIYKQAIENTNVFANMIEEIELDYSFKYPNLYGNNATKLWKQTIIDKFQYKEENNIIDTTKIDEYKEKINEEFETMKKQGMESFMLFMSELVDYCNDNDIPYGFCRGSVGGSEVAFITDITDLDPIKWNTVFSRFCNADRISLGDIDIDFAPEDRKKVFEFIINKIGKQKTAYIAQFGTLKDRGTIDVLAKGLDYHDLTLVAEIKDEFDKLYHDYSKIIQAEVNLEELEVVEAKSIDFDYHNIYIERIRREEEIKKLNNIKNEFENLKKNNKDLFYYFEGIKGTIIQKGNHPAGIIGSPITIPDNLGVFYKDGDENFPVCQCAMKAVDSLNYVKFDILGLKTVGIMKDTYELIGSHYLKSHEIDWNDEKVWNNMITSPVGVFQFEGDYAFSLLEKFQPRYINDMSLVNAALRPSGKSYRDKLIRKEFNKNPSEEIDELLKENYGFLVYQEDTIKFLTDICGFSGSLADTTRRAIGKKDNELLQEQLPKILDGYCKKSSKSKEIAEQEAKQFLRIIDDSSEYQFGYNHSTGYSMNGYACTRLRTYFPLEFTTAYLNRIENEEDITMGTKLAKQLNIKILPIKFGKSHAKYTPDKETNSIYKGIESIKFCNTKIADELFELGKNKYNHFLDLLIDIQKISINSRQLTILTQLNFFSEFGRNKKLLDFIDLFDQYHDKKSIKKDKLNEQTENILKKYAKETPKTYKEFDSYNFLLEMWDLIPNDIIGLNEQISTEILYLGYPQTTIHNLDYPIGVVLSVDLKYAPKIIVHKIQDGSQKQYKIFKKYFNKEDKILETGDIILIQETTMRNKTKYINGEYEKLPEMEDFLTKYYKPNLDKLNNYIKNLNE